MKYSSIGQGVDRVDGPQKVTGRAQYAAEPKGEGLAYGVIVSSDIARGRIQTIDSTLAMQVPGVIKILTHENRPGTAWFDRSYKDDVAPKGSPFRPLYDGMILFNGQPIALVIAETFDEAREAALLIQVKYKAEAHATDLREESDHGVEPKGKLGYEPPPKPRGDVDRAFQSSNVRLASRYESAPEFHNPMEMHASTVLYAPDGSLTIYDKTQGVQNSQRYVCEAFNLSKEVVKVLSPFVGGAFGSALRPQHQLFLAVLGALDLKRSLRVVLTRQQMFSFGHRPRTIQHLALGADANGILQSIEHEALGETSRFEGYCENVVNWSANLYLCENVKVGYKVAPIDLYTPCDMRAPGAVLGIYALECMMDEIAAACGVDPLQLRLLNYADSDQVKDRPFSSKELKRCYAAGAERFGWSKRNPQPRSMEDGDEWIGYGMATGSWESMQGKASARARLSADGRLTVSSATADIGTGTYTIMTQIAAETLGLSLGEVTFILGDSTLPTAPIEGGSMTAATVGTAVQSVCQAIGDKLIRLAKAWPHSGLADAPIDAIELAEGTVRLKKDPTRSVPFVSLLAASPEGEIIEDSTTLPNLLKMQAYTSHSHSAVFVEVGVDKDFGTIRVRRVVSAIAGGRILNPKTARSQILGGIVWGIGMALQEEGLLDHRLGRFMNTNLSEYHVPVHADIQNLDVIFVDEVDSMNPLGVKGLGEIGIVGVAAAIGNAVYHATGKRVRQLPITLDKVLEAPMGSV